MNEIRETIQKYVDSGEIAGAVYIVNKNGKVAAEGAVGYADIAGQTTVNRKPCSVLRQ